MPDQRKEDDRHEHFDQCHSVAVAEDELHRSTRFVVRLVVIYSSLGGSSAVQWLSVKTVPTLSIPSSRIIDSKETLK